MEDQAKNVETSTSVSTTGNDNKKLEAGQDIKSTKPSFFNQTDGDYLM